MLRFRAPETALRAKDIVRNAFSTDKRNAKFVAPSKVELTRHGYCVYTITKIPGQRARVHKTLCNMEPGYKGAFNRCPSIKILCDCARHKFVWNYALQEYDAAIKNVTNGEPPVVTNPSEIPGCCIDGDAWINTEFGSKRLKDVRVGERVQTLNGLRHVIETSDMGVKDTILIYTKSGRKLQCTPDHQIFTMNGWICAKDVVGHFLVISNHVRKWPVSNSNLYHGYNAIAAVEILNQTPQIDKDITDAHLMYYHGIGDIHFEQAVAVVPDKEMRVYDIGVDGTPHFFANGICVHNCKHGVISLSYLMQLNPRWTPPLAEVAAERAKLRDKPIKLSNLHDVLTRIRQNKSFGPDQ